jgi:hypothetical protein
VATRGRGIYDLHTAARVVHDIARRHGIPHTSGEVRLDDVHLGIQHWRHQHIGAQHELFVHIHAVVVLRVVHPQRPHHGRAVLVRLREERVHVGQQHIAQGERLLGGLGDGGPQVQLLRRLLLGVVVAGERVVCSRLDPASTQFFVRFQHETC